ncbi:uncharacterized protein [Rutidosis leptorrhynchoides]|uniref:uncharacterized protein n=1 Tax=Rutidosis leptorrhynchoides TaxID=125765 RepID=UPI003A996D6E
MACATTTRPTFFFHHLSHPKLHSTPPPPLFPKLTPITIQKCSSKLNYYALNSIDVSKEDNPTSSNQPDPTPQVELEVEEEGEETFDKRRLEEKFAVLNTGIYECRSCGFKYDESIGDPSYPIPPGFNFEKLPDDWRCSTCGAAKSFFQSKSVEIAGFAQNQQYGLGGNSLTSGQKTLLIYGTLLFFFALFLSGYFIQ